jgi:hypothetical protein
MGDVSCPASEFIYIYFSFTLFVCFFPCLEWELSCIGTEIPRVASHLFTGSLAGISKLPALAGRYIRFGIFVAPFCGIFWELLFLNLAGTYFFLNRGAGVSPSKRGQKPPFEGKKRFPPNVQYQNVPTEFSFSMGW